MLEKIGLPAKPTQRGNNWVLDASHCQGCCSQFTFVNRKHHCRRCGGLFCNNCTLQRMVLRGQGESPVRICEPCKKLEEAARFELRHGHKAKAGRGGVRFKSNPEDEVLRKILVDDRKESLSMGEEINDVIQRATSSSSFSSSRITNVHDMEGEISRSFSVDVLDHIGSEMASASPDELRQQALDEKKKYKILKDKGKNAEGLQAFKRAKELERKAEALEINLRKIRKRSVVSDKMVENMERDPKDSGRKNKEVGKEKPDLTAELRELGWSDMDLHDEDKKSTTITLEGELLSLVKGVSQKTNKDNSKNIHVIENAQVVAHKRKALILKREGKLVEAKEELKRAKILEKQLEEQELLAGAEDSDDELSALIRSMDDDKQEEISIQFKQDPGFDFTRLLGAGEDLLDSNFEVTEDDMEDPEIAGALESLGWTEDSTPNHSEKIAPLPVHGDRESLASEIYSLKREALNHKRAGNIAEAMEQLKKAKLLEKDLERFDSQADNVNPLNIASPLKDGDSQNAVTPSKLVNLGVGSVKPVQEIDTKLSSKSRLSIQRELLDLKKKALALKREGRLDEADKLLNDGKVLEYQLEQMDNNTKEKAAPVSVSAGSKSGLMHKQHNASKNAVDDEEIPEDVTDQDMHDPTYLSLLKNLGWNNEDDELANPPSKSNEQNDVFSIGISESSKTSTTKLLDRPLKRSKAEVQRELLGLKRKALALRRQGQNDEADEVLGKAKELEKEIDEIESRNNEVGNEFNSHQERTPKLPLETVDEEGAVEDVTDKDMHDPALLSVLKNLGWKDDDVSPEQEQVKSNEQNHGYSVHPPVNQSSSAVSSINQSSSIIPNAAPRSKGEIQKELLNLKRKALALRRKGETNEADEVLKLAKALEMQMEELEAPKPAVSLNITEDNESVTYQYSRKNKNQEPMVEAQESTKEANAVAVGPKDEANLSSFTESQGSGSIAFLTTPDISIEKNQPMLTKGEPVVHDFAGNTGMTQGTQFIPPAGKSVNMFDLLTGGNWGNSQAGIETHTDVFNSTTPNQLGTWKKSDNVASKDSITIVNEKVIVQRDSEQPIQEELASQPSKVSLQQEILAHKRQAVALKREGRLADALEELRQAKLLEKSLEENTSQVQQLISSDLSISASIIHSSDQKEHDSAAKPAPKILSGRERFKLQQESLSHKRQALKLRREGRIQEAESEFELAKAIETQLEAAARDSGNGNGPADDVGVEDFLDPQLLSALRAIGIEGPGVASRGQSISEPVKVNVAKSETSDVVERTQLEEQIKAEKIKAVNLKRSGKPSEALDALRRAKLLEKKLNSS